MGNKEETLLYACRNENLELVKRLINEGKIDVNYKDKYAWSALSLASRHCSLEIIKELLKHPKIDVNIQNMYGITPLINLCYYNKNEAVKELLKHPQINLDIKNVSGENAYDLAKERDSKETMFLLKAKKLKQTIYNSNGKF